MTRPVGAFGLSLLAIGLIAACQSEPAGERTPDWVSIFDGETLNGWTPKITGQAPGEDILYTFRAEDGLLRVVYENYESFDNQFGLLYFEQPLTHYRLRLSYRFRGEQLPNAPVWAKLNSGVMLHAQAPETMARNQLFPVSIEAQFLASDPAGPSRTTLNLCSPGSHVYIGTEKIVQHCVDASAPAAPTGEWVDVEFEVRGNEVIHHIINGEAVLTYTAPELDPTDPDAAKLIEQGAPLRLSGGYIALQSESHPVDFKDIQLLDLSN